MNIINPELSNSLDSLTENIINSSMETSRLRNRLESLKEELAEAEETGDIFMSALILDEIIELNFELKDAEIRRADELDGLDMY